MTTKISVVSLLLIFLYLTSSCKKDEVAADKDIVINEIMPVNTTIVADQNGEFDDWFELYNLTSLSLDISGYYLSDNKDKRAKWKVPEGTTIPAGGYLVIWADKDTTQSGLHANFKLSSAGEELVISKPDLTVIDELAYPSQSLELSYSRIPDGTGKFKWKSSTFNISNSSSR